MRFPALLPIYCFGSWPHWASLLFANSPSRTACSRLHVLQATGLASASLCPCLWLTVGTTTLRNDLPPASAHAGRTQALGDRAVSSLNKFLIAGRADVAAQTMPTKPRPV